MTAQPVVAHPGTSGSPTSAPSLLDVVRDLRRDVQRTRFPLEIPGVADARAERSRLLDHICDHLVPRLEQLAMPAVVVVAGSTGAGKSTLLNSLLGQEVSAAGVLRPTTRQPVLVHHPLDADLLERHPLTGVVDVVGHERAPRGVALLDAPDLDSVLEHNRDLADRLLEAADLWLFVTTAARYGDALPWGVLESAARRHAPVAMVLNRVAADALSTVRGDLLQRLRERGLDDVPLFTVPDAGPHEGLLDVAAVAPVTRWLMSLAGPDHARTVIARSLRGSLEALDGWVEGLAAAVQDQVDAAAVLRAEVVVAVTEPALEAEDAVLAGSVADGAAHARWAELTSGGPLARVLGRSGRLRGTRRAGRRRETALLGLAQDLHAAATAQLSGAGAAGERALRAGLTRPDAPVGAAELVAPWPGADHVAARESEAARSGGAWVTSADVAVRHLLTAPDPAVARPAAAAAAALGQRGVAVVALAAAAGLDPAERLLTAALPTGASSLVDRLRDDLVVRARTAVALEGESLEELLDVPALTGGAVSRLRAYHPLLEGLR